MTTAIATVNNEPTTMVLLQMAMDKDLDADKLEKLMQLHERAQDREAEREFAEAMNACQTEMPAIVRDALNKQTNSKYARLETVNEQIKGIYVRHGLSLSFGTESSPLEHHIRVTCDVMHSGGHVKHYQADFPLDDAGMQGSINKTPMHATGSTMSYGRRYLIYLIFNLSLANEDNDGNGSRPLPKISEEQAIQIKELLEDAGMPLEEFLTLGRISKVEDLTLARHPNALEAIALRRKQNRAAK
jgi:hypothetical protein